MPRPAQKPGSQRHLQGKAGTPQEPKSSSKPDNLREKTKAKGLLNESPIQIELTNISFLGN